MFGLARVPEVEVDGTCGHRCLIMRPGQMRRISKPKRLGLKRMS